MKFIQLSIVVNSRFYTRNKKLIKYCELDWDEDCLKHYNNNSPIKTASVNQVRKPIYNSSINLFDKYSEFFEGSFQNLEEN